MSYTFTPSNLFDTNKERDWQASLGMMDWDSTKIVFTKRSFLEFLSPRSIGTTVDPNFTNISKLPRYAKFGKIIGNEEAIPGFEATVSASVSSVSDLKPSRRVRDPPGERTNDILNQEVDDDALSKAPPRLQDAQATERATEEQQKPIEEEETGFDFPSLKPSRRVTTAPGGTSSMSSILHSADPTPEEFKPSRRVRQGPGGQDHIHDFFS